MAYHNIMSNILSQEKLLLSIFPKDVAHAVQRDLKEGHLAQQDNSLQFRKLYINRFENVRYALWVSPLGF